MSSKQVKKCLQDAADRFIKAEKKALQGWDSPCGCPNPGGELKCIDCVYCIELIENIQRKLHPHPESVFPQKVGDPLKHPYSEAVKQQCIKLYKESYSLEQISHLMGVLDRRALKNWLKSEGLLKGDRDYSESEKQHCADLYLAGFSPIQIENQTGISADLISNWMRIRGQTKPRTQYSSEQREQSLSLYQQGSDLSEIEQITGVPQGLVRYWANRAGIERSKRFGGGRPRVYPPEIREACRQLLESGASVTQVSQKLGISDATIRQWKKDNSL
ncbi:transposase [Kamptonema cortianum]|nr:transposase [Kamptonema cortianum]